MKVTDKFLLNNQVAVITGGAGLLGEQHAESIAEAGGIPVLWDIDVKSAEEKALKITKKFNVNAFGDKIDITDKETIKNGLEKVVKKLGRIDILINNAANDPKVKDSDDNTWSRFENYSLDMWQNDMDVGLMGAFLCSQVIGSYMADNKKGVILNISSDLGVISPDQRLYRKDNIPENEQPVKPVTYSVVKHGLIGLTKYISTYWTEQNIRCNALSPGGVYVNQPDDFVDKLTNLIPMGRMAKKDEYKAAVVFLCSNASSYMTGQNLIINGGRTVL